MSSENRSPDPVPNIDGATTACMRVTLDPVGGVPPTREAVTPPVVPGLYELPYIAGYEIEAELSRGGMGRVLAGRELSLDREVAIKVLLPRTNVQRFLTESRITAQLPHPNIPPVYALGRLIDGSPYLAMKRIHGRTLHNLIDDRAASSVPQFVAIFEQIAQAVGFAHSRGVIHRDLKPANVMVGAFGEVQVMDWGLARSTEGTSPEAPGDADAREHSYSPPELTRVGTVMGTPAFMAPEQARGERVDARADVFALGCILTAILTGQSVYSGQTDEETLSNAAAGNTADAMARLDGCAADPQVVAIAKRCLHVDPALRPADGRAVAALVSAYRADVAERLRQAETARATVEAKASEQHKRRRLAKLAAAAVAAVLVVGIVGTTAGLIQATAAAESERRAKHDAEDQQAKALAAADAEKRSKVEAEGQRAKAEEAAAAEKRATAEATRLKAVAEHRADAEVAAHGRTRQTYQILLSIFEGLDVYRIQTGLDSAVVLLANRLVLAGTQLDATALGGDPVEVAKLQHALGVTLMGLGHSGDAVPLFQKALAVFKARLGADDASTLTCTNNLASGYRDVGRFDRAVPLFEETLARRKATLGADHPQTLKSVTHLAIGYQAVGRFEHALPLFEEAFKRTKERLGADHPDTLEAANGLACALNDAGQFDLAIPLLQETLKLRKVKLGDDHPDTLTSMNNLAVGYQRKDDIARAMPLFEEAFKLRKARLGPDHPLALASMSNLADCYWAAGERTIALAMHEENYRLWKNKLGADHPDTLVSLSNLAQAYQNVGRVDLALPYFEACYRSFAATLGADHPHALTGATSLAKCYREVGRFDRARELLEQTLPHLVARYGRDHRLTQYSQGELALTYLELDRGRDAVPLFREFFRVERARAGANDPEFAQQLAIIAAHLLRAKVFAEAERYLAECLAVRAATAPRAWSTFHTKSLLGEALLGQRKFDDALPLLVEGYQGLKAVEKSIPAQSAGLLPEAVERLVRLFDAQGKPDVAAKWRAERAKYPPEPAPRPRAAK